MKLAIINAEQQYNTDLEAFCEKNCIMQIMNYYGVSNPLLYLDTALNIHLFEAKEKMLGYDVKFNEKCFMKSYSHKIQKHYPMYKSNLEIWEENKVKIKEGIPIVTSVDMFCLNYSANYNIYHSNHKCILCGYSNDNQYATLIDKYEWNYKGDVLLDDFLRARSSLCPLDDSPYSGYPIENEWLEIEDSNWSIDKRKALKETIDKIIKQYYENDSINDSKNFYGISALRKIHELFMEKKDSNKVERSELIRNIRLVFLLLYTRQKFFRYYIREASRFINMGLLSDLLESLNEDIELWRKTTIIMLRASISVTESSCKKIVDKMKELIDLEEKRYHLLTHLCKIL